MRRSMWMPTTPTISKTVMLRLLDDDGLVRETRRQGLAASDFVQLGQDSQNDGCSIG